jgi:hypothetical protein
LPSSRCAPTCRRPRAAGDAAGAQPARLRSAVTADPQSAERQQEDPFAVASRLRALPTIQQQVLDYVIARIPTFVYMDEYRSFRDTAWLDQIHQKKLANQLDEDKMLLMILELAGLNLDSLIQKGGEKDKEDRQYVVSDGATNLTREISSCWKKRMYKVDYSVDGNQFMSFVRDERDGALIKLGERSRGFSTINPLWLPGKHIRLTNSTSILRRCGSSHPSKSTPCTARRRLAMSSCV